MRKRRKISVLWDTEAFLYLQEALKFIRKKSPSGSEKVKKAILSQIEDIRINPWIYEPDKLRYSNDGAYRAFVVYDYRVTYKITASAIIILRVRHTSQEPLEY